MIAVSIKSALRWCLYSFLAGMALGPVALSVILKVLGRFGVAP